MLYLKTMAVLFSLTSEEVKVTLMNVLQLSRTSTGVRGVQLPP